MALTKTTNSVISANTIINTLIANNAIADRHLNANIISLDMLTANVTANLITGGGTVDDFHFSNRVASIGSTLVDMDVPSQNIKFIANNYEVTVPVSKIFGSELVTGNLTVEGDLFTTNGQIAVTTSNIILNSGGTVAAAKGTRLSVEGGGVLLANVVFNAGARNKFRVGVGALGVGNDIATFTDLGTNLISFSNTYISDGSNTMIVNSPNPAATEDFAMISLGGLNQSSSQWLLQPNNTIQFKEINIPAGLQVQINVWFPA